MSCAIFRLARVQILSDTVLHIKTSTKKFITHQFLFQKFRLVKFLNLNVTGGMRRVQILCDICTRFARYLYSTKQSWITMYHMISEHEI